MENELKKLNRKQLLDLLLKQTERAEQLELKLQDAEEKLASLAARKSEHEELLDQSLLQWAKEESSVIFCGATKVVEQFVSAMDAYVLPSYREGFGSTVIEAESMGVPVIISDIPGPTDAMIRDVTGLVVKKADVDTLHDAMVRLYDDADLRSQFGEAAYAFATEKFDQNQLFAHILEDRKRLLNMR